MNRDPAFAPAASDGARRHFVTVSDRQLHLSAWGSGPVLIALAGLPYASSVHRPIAAALAAHFSVLALDTPGYGLSDPLTDPAPTAAAYAADLLAALDVLGVGRFALYGAQFGAVLGLELAMIAPDRVVSLVLGELPVLDAARRRALADTYIPETAPRLDGGHLLAHWRLRRDEHVFFPWFATEPAHRLAVDLTAPGVLEERLHQGVLDQLDAPGGFTRAYPALFAADVPGLLAAVRTPVTILAGPQDTVPSPRSALIGIAPVRELTGDDDLGATIVAASRPGDPVATLPDPTPIPGRIWRTYARTPWGELLVRRWGAEDGAPLIMFHASPGDGRRLEPIIAAIEPGRAVYALDTLGNGASSKPTALRTPELADFAAVVIAGLDDLGLGTVDLYGNHTGSLVAAEVALAAPERVRGLVLDGITLFDERENADFLDGYFLDLTPRSDGTHLVSAFATARDGRLWFPWHRRRPAAIAGFAALSPEALHASTLDMLRSGPTYSLSYSAVFRHRTADRLATLRVPTLVCHAPGDPLARFTDPAVAMIPGAVACALPSAEPAEIAATVVGFIDGLD